MLTQRLATLAGLSGVVISICAAGALAGACAAQGGGSDDGGGGSGTSGTGVPSASVTSGYVTSGTSGGSRGSVTSGSVTSGSVTSGSVTSGSVSGSVTSGSISGSVTSGTVSGTVTTSGTASGTVTTSGTASGTATTGTCAITAAGGLALGTGGYFAITGSTATPGGYSYAFSDGITPGGSTACVSTTELCGSGNTGAQNPPTYTIYGGGFGFNVDQALATSATSPPVGQAAVTGSGITYAVSGVPTQGLRVIIDNGPGATAGSRNDFCATATAASGTIPWASFNTKCYDNPVDGTALTAAPTMATHVQFQAPAGAAAGAFDFCVTAFSFAP